MTTQRKTKQPARPEALERILRLEAERGYDNRAVMGGLDRFLDRWRRELEAAGDQKSLGELSSLLSLAYQRVVHDQAPSRPTTYGELTPAQRETWARFLLERLAQVAAAPPTPMSGSPRAAGDGPAGPQPRSRAPRAQPAAARLSLDAPATVVPGVGPAIAAKLQALGVTTVRELLYHFPRRHLAVVPIRDLALGEEQAVVGNVWTVGVMKLGAAQHAATEAVIGDETGNIRVMWYNQPFVARSVQANDRIMVSGRMRPFRGQRTLEATAYEVLTGEDEVLQQGRLAPVYPSTEGLSQRMLRRVVRRTLDGWLSRLEEFLPQGILQRQGLMPLPQALLGYHYPADAPTRDLARRRLAFDELLLIQLVLLSRKQHWQEEGAGTPIPRDARLLEAFLRSLPFTLTGAQERALEEILADLASPRPMARLLQGDVGSGKTVVALAAMLMVAAQGQQAALMAPTAILAEQHFRTFGTLLQGLSKPVRQPNFLAVYIDPFPKPLGVALLVGSMKKREKEEVQSRVREHLVDILVGTHALIQEEVGFERLALAVADEQHRFGVVQRRLLSEKGHRPHILSMSATPIPRSLALTLYGDLDISIIDEMPRGRRPIRTRWVGAHQRQAAYNFLQRQVQQGRQAFVICPLIQESETLQTKAAVEEHRRLSKEVLPDLRIGLLHGRMPAADKDAVMGRFRSGELDILVSTPVVEVGVDIPNASVIFIEGADRFGLSELHQFRGRVGRGEHPSYCLLLAEDPSPEAKERLALLERESDGFRVAEEDLRLRGPGELLGTRQSGLPPLKLARLSDLELLAQARLEAGRLLAEDPELARPEHQELARTAARVTPAAEGQGTGDGS